jgi:hypothetical protein
LRRGDRRLIAADMRFELCHHRALRVDLLFWSKASRDRGTAAGRVLRSISNIRSPDVRISRYSSRPLSTLGAMSPSRPLQWAGLHRGFDGTLTRIG